jgi:dehydrogenase/reductase SDR family member 4
MVEMYKRFELSGKVAVLTGSTAGMGLAIARGLAECGASVVVSSHRDDDTDATARLLSSEGFAAKGIKCDITNRNDVESFGERASGAFGKVDVLFCLAAEVPEIGSILSQSPETLRRLLSTTVVNTHSIVQQLLPGMVAQRDGSIIVMSSIASERASPGLAGYGVTKAALNSYVRSVAAEFGEFNIRANAIAPSFVRTEFAKDIWSDKERAQMMINKVPLKRLADPDDVVGPSILLASSAGSYISGQVILIDGGRSIA